MKSLHQAYTYEAITLDLTGVDGSHYQVSGYRALCDGRSIGLGYWVDRPKPSSIEMVLNGKPISIPRTWELSPGHFLKAQSKEPLVAAPTE